MTQDPPTRGPREPGSPLTTYYKVQWWDARNLPWHDIQQSFPSIAAARAAYPAGRRCRVMEVTPEGRQPIA
jgi:hypothetical protein